MAKTRTRAELEEQIRHLETYQALAFALMDGYPPIHIAGPDDKTSAYHEGCTLYAPHRSHGGIVVWDGSSAQYADETCNALAANPDPYARELGRKIRAEQKRAIDSLPAAWPKRFERESGVSP